MPGQLLGNIEDQVGLVVHCGQNLLGKMDGRRDAWQGDDFSGAQQDLVDTEVKRAVVWKLGEDGASKMVEEFLRDLLIGRYLGVVRQDGRRARCSRGLHRGA